VQVLHAVQKLQPVTRGHSGRRLFTARCNHATRQLMHADGCAGTNDDAVADEAPPPAQVSAPVHDDAAAPALGENEFIVSMLALYNTRVRL